MELTPAELKKLQRRPRGPGDCGRGPKLWIIGEELAEAGQSYYEAIQAEEQAKKLKSDEEARAFAAHRKSQRNFIKVIRRAHHRDMLEFKECWDAKLAEFEEYARQLREALTVRLEMETSAHRERLRKLAGQRTIKASPHVLALQEEERLLTKQGNYLEAELRRNEAQHETAAQERAWEEKFAAAARALDEKLKWRQRKEMQVLDKRICSGRQERAAARDQEFRFLTSRFSNVMASVRRRYNIDFGRLTAAGRDLKATLPACGKKKRGG